MKQYSHLTRDERIIISTLFFKENRSINYIAKNINKNKSTISRELKRNTIYMIIIYQIEHTKNTWKQKTIAIRFYA